MSGDTGNAGAMVINGLGLSLLVRDFDMAVVFSDGEGNTLALMSRVPASGQ